MSSLPPDVDPAAPSPADAAADEPASDRPAIAQAPLGYRIRAVSAATGVPAATLRAWERRYGVPCPERGPNGYRMYSEQSVCRVRRMIELGRQGLAPAEAARVVLAEPNVPLPPDLAGRPGLGLGPSGGLVSRAVEPGRPAADSDSTREPGSDARAIAALLRAVEALDPAELLRRLRAFRRAADSPWATYRHIVRPLLQQIGVGWESGRLSVAAEHLAARAVSAELRAWLEAAQPAPEAPLLLLACVSGEQHELPLQAVALHAAHLGWRAVVLGSRTPPAALAAAVQRLRPAAIGLSVTVPMLHHDPHTLFAAYARACGSTPWIVGGRAAPAHAAVLRAAGARLATDDAALRRFVERVSAWRPS